MWIESLSIHLNSTGDTLRHGRWHFRDCQCRILLNSIGELHGRSLQHPYAPALKLASTVALRCSFSNIESRYDVNTSLSLPVRTFIVLPILSAPRTLSAPVATRSALPPRSPKVPTSSPISAHAIRVSRLASASFSASSCSCPARYVARASR